MTRQEITTDDAPESIGPFSQGIKTEDTVYVSGQGPIDPETGEIVRGDIQEQTERTMKNIQAILEAADTSLENALKVTIYVTDMDNYDSINEAYEEYVEHPFPARSAVEVADLPVDIGVEIEVIAARE